MDELRVTANALNADVIVITESWLHDGISNDLLQLNLYEIFRCDRRNRKGGGVCIWTHHNFSPSVLLPLSPIPPFIELVLVRLRCTGFSILCCGVYVPPGLAKSDHDQIVDFLTFELDRFLTLYHNDRILIAGDFNDFCTDFLIENFSLVNRVTEATRQTAMLDHIWIDEHLCDFYNNPAEVGPPIQNSDHNTILLHPTHHPPSHDKQFKLVWDFRESHVAEFLRHLESTDYDSLADEPTIDSMCSKFYSLLSGSIAVIPCEQVVFSVNDKPWMTPVLKTLINKRWNAFRCKNWSLFRHYKDKVKQEIIHAKRIWSERQSQTTRGLWKVVNSLRGASTKEPWRRLFEEAGGFQELLGALTSEFQKSFNADDDVQLLPLSNQKWSLRITPKAVFDELSRLSCRKASGPDNVPPTLLKAGAHVLCFPLSVIFNFSIQSQTYPNCFKRAHICPIPKCHNASLSDFRPISILSCISKVFERLVLNGVKHELYQCYGLHQHAYRPLSSTTTALVEICEYITRSLDCVNTSHVNVYCLDLSRAFDKLQHNRLLNYLSSSGLNHGFLLWLQSYLLSRTFCVKICDRFGPVTVARSGVPQGSVLGPYLFAAFMGSILFSQSNVQCVKYADDITLIESISLNQAHVSSISLATCTSLFDERGLTLNRSKCKLLRIIRSPSAISAVDCDFENVDSVKILGFILTHRFDWKAQVSHVIKLASQRLYVIRCLKNCLSTSELLRVYHALITSIILYASPVYGQLPVTLFARLEKLQRRAHRLICGHGCPCDGFPCLRRRFEEAAIKVLQQAESNHEHPLHDYVPGRLPNTNLLRLPVCRTNRRLNSFVPWASRVSNSYV